MQQTKQKQDMEEHKELEEHIIEFLANECFDTLENLFKCLPDVTVKKCDSYNSIIYVYGKQGDFTVYSCTHDQSSYEVVEYQQSYGSYMDPPEDIEESICNDNNMYKCMYNFFMFYCNRYAQNIIAMKDGSVDDILLGENYE